MYTNTLLICKFQDIARVLSQKLFDHMILFSYFLYFQEKKFLNIRAIWE
jgi:hypothetical protein